MEYGPLGSNEHLGTLAVDVKQIREHLKEWIATNQQVQLMSILGCLAAEFSDLLAGVLRSCGLNRQALHGKSISVVMDEEQPRKAIGSDACNYHFTQPLVFALGTDAKMGYVSFKKLEFRNWPDRQSNQMFLCFS